MAKNILELVIKLTKDGSGDKQTVSSLVSIKQGMGQLAIVAGTVTAAVAAVDMVLDATTGKFVSYAGEIRSSSAALSLNAEDTSRLKQVMEDFGVELDSVQKALYTARKEGLDITVEGLADMADQYNALTDPQEKAIWLQEKFGKSGIILAEVLTQGREKILAQNEAVQQGLILNEQEVATALEYEQALGDLKDVKDSLAITTGQVLIPLQIAFLNYVNDSLAGWQQLGIYIKNVKAQGETLQALSTQRIELLQEIERYEQSVAAGENPYNTKKLTELRQELELTEGKIAELKSGGGIPEALGDMTQLEDQSAKLKDIFSISKQIMDVEEKRAEYNADLAEAVELYGANSEQAETLRGKIEELDRASQQWTNQFVLGLLQAQLAADGVLTADDVQVILDAGIDMGILSDKAQEAYQNAVDLANAIQGIPTSTDIDINLHVNTSGNGVIPGTGKVVTETGLIQDAPTQTYAGGGVPSPDELAVVGDIAGTGWGPHAEVLYNGRVIPHAQAQVLKDMGLLDSAPAYGSGGIFGGNSGSGDFTRTRYVRGRNSARGRIGSASKKTNTGAFGVAPSGAAVQPFGAPAGPAGSGSAESAASIAAVEAVTPVVVESVQTMQAAQETTSRENSRQVARQTAAVQETGATQTAVLEQILAAIEGQAEKLAAEIQKGR